jgi:hypothetical protein
MVTKQARDQSFLTPAPTNRLCPLRLRRWASLPSIDFPYDRRYIPFPSQEGADDDKGSEVWRCGPRV